MNRLLHPVNQFDGQTGHSPRPSRQHKEWRYLDEGALVLAQDRWDTAERARQHLEVEGRRIDRDIAERAAADEQAKRDRDNDVVNITLRSRYVTAGGDVATFERDLPELRREFAKMAALGLAEPVDSMATLKAQLRAARAGRNLFSPDATVNDAK